MKPNDSKYNYYVIRAHDLEMMRAAVATFQIVLEQLMENAIGAKHLEHVKDGDD